MLEIGSRPLLMGIVNATPDSFSDGGDHPSLEARFAHGAALLEAGADLLDVGGESASGHRPAVTAVAEIDRVVPLIVRLTAELGAVVSVDTYKPEVAEAAIAAGARWSMTCRGCAISRWPTSARRAAPGWCRCTRAWSPRARCSIPTATTTSWPT